MHMNIFIWFVGICTYTITHNDVRISTGTHAHRKIGTSRIECGGEWDLGSVLVVCLRLCLSVSVLFLYVCRCKDGLLCGGWNTKAYREEKML